MLRTSTVCCELPPPSTPGGAKIFFFFAPDGELGQEEVQGIPYKNSSISSLSLSSDFFLKKGRKKHRKFCFFAKKKIKKGVKRSRASLAKIETLRVYFLFSRAQREFKEEFRKSPRSVYAHTRERIASLRRERERFE